MASRAEDLDAATVAAIAVIAYCLANQVHEGLGHGGACLLAGGTPKMLNAIFFDMDDASISATARRWVAAGGSMANLVFAGLAVLLNRALRNLSASARYFLWLFFSLNLLQAFGYWLFSGIMGVGDWARVIEGYEPRLAFRAGLAVTGALLYFLLAPKLIRPGLEPFLGRDGALRPGRARRLLLLPYLVGGTTYVLAGLLNPYGLELVLVSAVAASFGGASLFAWYPSMLRKPRPDTPEQPLALPRSTRWAAAAALCLVLFVGVLGRGIGVRP